MEMKSFSAVDMIRISLLRNAGHINGAPARDFSGSYGGLEDDHYVSLGVTPLPARMPITTRTTLNHLDSTEGSYEPLQNVTGILGGGVEWKNNPRVNKSWLGCLDNSMHSRWESTEMTV